MRAVTRLGHHSLADQPRADQPSGSARRPAAFSPSCSRATPTHRLLPLPSPTPTRLPPTASKPVFGIEYNSNAFSKACPKQVDFGIRFASKTLKLEKPVTFCSGAEPFPGDGAPVPLEWTSPNPTNPPTNPTVNPTDPWWRPKATDGLQHQYQLSVEFNPNTDMVAGVSVYMFDGEAATKQVVAAIKAKGGYPVCYFSAGSFEDWRTDAGDFQAGDKGSPLDGWPGEWWLNINSANVKTIMLARMQSCKDKGFVAVDPDNVDGYTNKNGLSLTAADQLAYNKWLADTAHSLGLAVGLKNDLDQIVDLVGHFDFFVNEQCMRYQECSMYTPAKQGAWA